jgi:hypothetical protein
MILSLLVTADDYKSITADNNFQIQLLKLCNL